MKLPRFTYHRPESLEEALALLAEHDDVKVLAGGQSLIPLMALRLGAPGHLVDIARLPDPAAELPAVAVASGASVVVRSVRGERVVPAAEFFEGYLSTALEPDELIVE